VLFERVSFYADGARAYDVAPDGQRFLMIVPDEEPDSGEMHIVLNWFEELRARR